MKISKKLFLLFLASAVFLSGVSLLTVNAENNAMTDEHIQKIKENCLSAKSTLNQLHASDALLRVNRGQIYESMSTMLMNGFNGRVSNNGLDNKSLVSITNNYNSTLDTFRSVYKTYEEHLSAAIGIDCLRQPVTFFDAVSLTSTNRERVHNQIEKLNQYVDEYQFAISKFEKDYLNSTSGAGH